ncbi:hypothetical protein ENBRE01_1304 [Enteropsectra breve]|nr:hypothetical protein ENBRE01_1304 [Enteropsectra breve]
MRIFAILLLHKTLSFSPADKITRYDRMGHSASEMKDVVNSNRACHLCHDAFRQTEMPWYESGGYQDEMSLRILQCPNTCCKSIFHKHCLISYSLAMAGAPLCFPEMNEKLNQLCIKEIQMRADRQLNELHNSCMMDCPTCRMVFYFNPYEFLSYILWLYSNNKAYLQDSDFHLMYNSIYIFKSLLLQNYGIKALSTCSFRVEKTSLKILSEMLYFVAVVKMKGTTHKEFAAVLITFINQQFILPYVRKEFFISSCDAFLKRSKSSIEGLLVVLLNKSMEIEKEEISYIILKMLNTANDGSRMKEFVLKMNFSRESAFLRSLDEDILKHKNFAESKTLFDR